MDYLKVDDKIKFNDPTLVFDISKDNMKINVSGVVGASILNSII